MPRKKSNRAEQSRALRISALCLVVTLAVLSLDFLAPRVAALAIRGCG